MSSSFAVGLAVLVIVLGSAVAAPTPPTYNDIGTDWQYTAADGSLIDGGHYHFRYYVSPAVNAARFQDFQDGYTQIYFRDYDNLTTTLVILYYKDNSCCIQDSGSPPFTQVASDRDFNTPLAPPDAYYVGQAFVDGFMCDGFEFIWGQDKLPVVQWVYTTPAGVAIPVRTTLAHNGRSIKYNEFTHSPDPAFYERDLARYQQVCTRSASCSQP